MERTSDKHSPRIDEQLVHDVEPIVDGTSGEARAQESRLQEDPAEDEPPIDFGARTDDDDTPGIGVSRDTADERAELARHVAAAQWPATRDELLAAARGDQAQAGVLDRLAALPEGERYENVQAVWRALGGEEEGAHTHAD